MSVQKVALDPSLLVDVAAFVDGATTFRKAAEEALTNHEKDAHAASSKIASAVDILVGCGSVLPEKKASVLEKAASHEGTAALLHKAAEIIAKQSQQLAAHQNQKAAQLASPGVAATPMTEKSAANGMGGGVGAAPHAGDADKVFFERMTGRPFGN